MNIVFIVPTGIGAEIGGHAGDATPAARLFAPLCDNLIVHPNVVNASDLNEMTENMLYVEGSILDLFLQGHIGLKKVRQNKILVAVNSPATIDIINSVSAARAVLGIDAEIIELATPFRMVATMSINGCASGDVFGVDELIDQVRPYRFDALAIISAIEVSKKVALDYANTGGVNPWGGVEALASKMVFRQLLKPVAHAPFDHTLADFEDIVDPRMSAEFVSVSYLHCVLKGLHKAPKFVGLDDHCEHLSCHDIDFMISPYGCFGPPHRACVYKGIPIIYVKENKTVLNDVFDYSPHIVVENYLEAAGIVCAAKAGVTVESVRRPLNRTKVRYWK